MIRTNEAHAYWLQPVNSAGIPGKKSAPRAVGALGPDGTSDDGPPPAVDYSASVEKYGLLTVSGISPVQDINLDGVTQVHVVAFYADEADLTTVPLGYEVLDTDETVPFVPPDGHVPGDYYFFRDLRKSAYYPPGQAGYYPPVSTRFSRDCLPGDDIVYVENPAGFPADEYDIYFETSTEGMKVVGGQGTNVWVVQRPVQGSRDFHAAGDLIFWYPTPPLEEIEYMTCAEAVQSDPDGGAFCWRRPPALRGISSGDLSTYAYFNSRITGHPNDGESNVLVRLRSKSFSIPIRRGFDIPGYVEEIPKRIDCVLPNALVYAVMVSLENYYGYGPWVTKNLARTWPATDDTLNRTVEPGLRTANGAAYIFQQQDIAVSELPVPPVRVQETARIRVAYATLETPSSSGDVAVQIKKRPAGEADWIPCVLCVIPQGQKTSWHGFDNPPAERTMPYSYPPAYTADWPTPLLEADAELCYNITSSGSGASGLMVVVQT